MSAAITAAVAAAAIVQDSSLPHWNPHTDTPLLLPPPPPDSRVIFTRQLWQRTMPEGSPSHDAETGPSRRTSSSASTRSKPQSPARRSDASETPLTPEESPPARVTRKRSAGEDKEVTTPSHSRVHSGDSAVQVCICQPDPKIPRPRNAFILYRQHYQANVVAQHPGLANPEISKIIGEQWRNEAEEVKSEWKGLAEEEKLRHQQQYPQYRYQPKRAGRRNSDAQASANGERPHCTKCGGRSILTPSTSNTPYARPASARHPYNTSTGPPTPDSAQLTPLTRTLPMLNHLSLASPAHRRLAHQFPQQQQHTMTPSRLSHPPNERDDLGPLSPDNKRRRYNSEHHPVNARAMPPRYGGQGPATPFPFVQGPPPHPYPPAASHMRRESLPGLRGVVSLPGQMAPPPRPGMGYQQHRLSQGHIPHDRSLTLPPLQTSASGVTGTVAAGGAGKSAAEIIMGMSFLNKIRVLGRVAPPLVIKKEAVRGPVIAVEGDDANAVEQLAAWLENVLAKDEDRLVRVVEIPKVPFEDEKVVGKQQYLRLVADWHDKSQGVIDFVTAVDSTRANEKPAPVLKTPETAKRMVDEDYNDSGDEASDDVTTKEKDAEAAEEEGIETEKAPTSPEKMDLDTTPPKPSQATSSKPLILLPNFSLHTSNAYACRIPIADSYSPADHWQWTATLWRGIIGPDLTIYVKDGVAASDGKQSVDIIEEDRVFVVKRTKGEKGELEIEAGVLRRLGFEVGEWVRSTGGRNESLGQM